MSNPKVIIRDHVYGEGNYIYMNNEWNMSTLEDAVEHLPVFSLQLAALDLSVHAWGSESKSISNFIYHFKRVYNANLDKPIILDPDGYIIDGWHRVVKAILQGSTTVFAVRLLVMPEPDRVNKE